MAYNCNLSSSDKICLYDSGFAPLQRDCESIITFIPSLSLTMVLTKSQKASLESAAPEFNLKGVDGKMYSLSDVKGEKGLVVMFICNHCPYVIAIKSILAEYGKEIQVRITRMQGGPLPLTVGTLRFIPPRTGFGSGCCCDQRQ